jgi:hypothetical protein
MANGHGGKRAGAGSGGKREGAGRPPGVTERAVGYGW